MFVLCSNIKIGVYTFKPNEVKVSKSVYQYADRAVIKTPISARIVQAGAPPLSVETAKQFTEGDRVLIQLGYNGSLTTEFEGFVSRVNFTQPLEVECEGFSYILRKAHYKPRTFVNAPLKDVLQYLVAGTEIKLAKDVIDSNFRFQIDKLSTDGKSGTDILEKIKRDSNETVRFFFIGNTLYAGMQWLQLQPDVKYQLGWNVIKDGQLKLREAKNNVVTVVAYAEQKDGTRLKAQKTNATQSSKKKIEVAREGIYGNVINLRPKGIKDQQTLEGIAKTKYDNINYDGYEGKITTFLIPYCGIAYGAFIDDKKYPERAGKYLVESVETTYGMQGARREIGIGHKL